MKKTSLLKAILTAAALTGSIVAVNALVTVPASAEITASKALVDAAKKQGIVGEKSNGYLGFVKGNSDAALKAAVDEINAGRSSVYGQAAAKNGVSIEAAGISAFANVILPKMASGEFYQNTAGVWMQK
ncbi:MAG: YdbL family protein [Asticcacaulis sp.]